MSIPRGKIVCVGCIAIGIIAILYNFSMLGMGLLMIGLVGLSLLYPPGAEQ